MTWSRSCGAIPAFILLVGFPELPGPYAIGRNVQVSAALATLRHYETRIDADPVRASHLIACAYVVRGDTIDNVFYVSWDRGRTWSHTLTVPHSVDPSCTIGPRGIGYAASIHDSLHGDSYLHVERSLDGGHTWSQAAVPVDSRSVDRAYVTAGSQSRGGKGLVYVNGYLQNPRDSAGRPLNREQILFSSEDDGATFARSVRIPAYAFPTATFIPTNGVVTRDGTFAFLSIELDRTRNNMFLGRSDSASAPAAVNGHLRLFRSSDRGRSLHKVAVADVYYDSRVPQLSMAALAADQTEGPFHGQLYAVWPDARWDHRTQVAFSLSADDGATWSAPTIISDDTAGSRAGQRPNNFMPAIAVNRQGVVGIMWYDRRDNPDNLGFWVRFAASLDGGHTWLASARVSDAPHRVIPGDTDIRFNAGDTSGLAADAQGIFHPAWIDNRTGLPQVWTTTITVLGKVRR
jgi:hypothetical protein